MADPISTNITQHDRNVDRPTRWAALDCHGATVWLTGLSGSGKSTIASMLEAQLIARHLPAYQLDGDTVRCGMNRDLGFSAPDRTENIRRIGELARLMADAGLVVIASFISPYRADRDQVRSLHENSRLPFIEVFVDTPLEICEQRDPKGLYKKARAGEITGFTGVDDPYESPMKPDLTLHTVEQSVDDCVRLILDDLLQRNIIPPDTPDTPDTPTESKTSDEPNG